MIEEIRLFFAPIGVVALAVSPFAGRFLWKMALFQRETAQILRGVNDNDGGVLGWKQEAEDKLNHAGVTLAQHGDRLTRVEQDVAQVRERYHKQANLTTEALMRLTEGKMP